MLVWGKSAKTYFKFVLICSANRYNARHWIANRPSNLIAKIAHTLAWFD